MIQIKTQSFEKAARMVCDVLRSNEGEKYIVWYLGEEGFAMLNMRAKQASAVAKYFKEVVAGVFQSPDKEYIEKCIKDIKEENDRYLNPGQEADEALKEIIKKEQKERNKKYQREYKKRRYHEKKEAKLALLAVST